MQSVLKSTKTLNKHYLEINWDTDVFKNRKKAALHNGEDNYALFSLQVFLFKHVCGFPSNVRKKES